MVIRPWMEVRSDVSDDAFGDFTRTISARRATATRAAAIFSIIASCRLHGLDPQRYLEEVLRVLPYWPRDRYLELAPNHWRATREKLAPDELDAPLCSFTVPAN